MESERPSTFDPARPWRLGLNVAVSVAAILALVLMANYLAVRHFQRLDWTAGQTYKLSPLTIHVLRSLTNDIKVTVFFKRDRKSVV